MSYGIFSGKIISPSKVVADQKVTMIKLPSEEGEMGVLFNHKPLVANLVPGIIKFQNQNLIDDFFVYGGVARITNDQTEIVSNFVLPLKGVTKNSISEKIAELETQLTSYEENDSQHKIILSWIKKYQSAIEFIEN